MKTTMEKLKETVQIINKIANHDLASTAGTYPAYKISSVFKQNNPKLSYAWDEVADVTNHIYNTVADILMKVRLAVIGYADAVENGDLELLKAIERTNEIAQTILNEIKSK